ncbi:hypothetical protein Btru_056752, partial [Bulinus truncatus]
MLYFTSRYSTVYTSTAEHYDEDLSEVYYAWDKDRVSPTDYVYGYCSRRCIGQEIVDLYDNSCFIGNCFDCHCKRPNCEIYNTCCPDITVPVRRHQLTVGNATIERGASSEAERQPVERKRFVPRLACSWRDPCGSMLSIRSCLPDYKENQTVLGLCEGHRSKYNETKETFFKVVDMATGVVYRNKLCALCNKLMNGAYPSYPCYRPKYVDIIHLLDVRTSKPQSINERACQNDKWASPDGELLNLKCDACNVILNGSCDGSADQRITRRGYNLRFWLDLFNPHHKRILYTEREMPKVLESLTLQLLSVLQENSEDICIHNSLVSPELQDTHDHHIFRFESSFLAKENLSINDLMFDFNKNVINLTITDEHQKVDDFFRTFNSLRSFSVDRKLFKYGVNESCHTTVNEIFKPVAQGSVEWINHHLVKFQQLYYLGHALRIFTQRYLCNGTDDTRKAYEFESINTFTNISGVFLCPYVSFEPSVYEMTVNDSVIPPNVSITIKFTEVKISFTDKEDFNFLDIDVNSTLNVCQDILNVKLKEMTERQKDVKSTNVARKSLSKYITNLVSFAISVACLLLTLMTYFLFPVLRNDAGINNMFLSSSLLLAQRYAKYNLHSAGHHDPLSMVVDDLVEFPLLPKNVSSICCSSKQKLGNSNNSLQNWKEDFDFTGASNTERSRGDCLIFVVVPLILITCSNLTFFLITVYKIYQTRRLQLSSPNVINENNKYLFIYAKLSTLTGAFWTVAVVAEALDNDVLQGGPTRARGNNRGALVECPLVECALVECALVECALVKCALVECALVECALVEYALIECALVEYRIRSETAKLRNGKEFEVTFCEEDEDEVVLRKGEE